MIHIYECSKLNSEKQTIDYKEIYTNNMKSVKEIFQRFEKDMKKREETKQENIESSYVG